MTSAAFSLPVLIAIAGGAALGALLRYFTSVLAFYWYGDKFPLATLLVNVAGSFLAGAVLLAVSRGHYSDAVRLFVIVGLCGALTTFSAFALETVLLLQQGDWSKALLNVGLNLFLCMAAVLAGFWITKTLLA